MENINVMECLIKDHLPYLQGLARHYTNDPLTAEDLLQETVLRIWNFREKFTAGTNFKAWASIIMRNLFINNCRKQKRKWEAINYLKERTAGSEPSALNAGELQLDHQAVMDLVQHLREVYRRPLLLFEAGYSYQEIADAMHTSIGTVKSRIHAARRRLKEQLLAA